MTSTKPTPYIYALMRTDYLSKDDEGHSNFISAHASLQSANRAAKAHVSAHSKSHGLKDANTNVSTFDYGAVQINVIVGEDDYHSFEVAVYKEELVGGGVVPDEGADEGVEVEEGKKGSDEVEAVKEEEQQKKNGAKKGKGTPKGKRGPAPEPVEGRRTSKRGKKE